MIRQPRNAGLGSGGLGSGIQAAQGSRLLNGAPQPAKAEGAGQQQGGLGGQAIGMGKAVQGLATVNPDTGRSTGGNALSWMRRQVGAQDPYLTDQQRQQQQQRGGGSPPPADPRQLMDRGQPNPQPTQQGPQGPEANPQPTIQAPPSQPPGPDPTITPPSSAPPNGPPTIEMPSAPPPATPTIAPPPTMPPPVAAPPVAPVVAPPPVAGLSPTGTATITGGGPAAVTTAPASISMAGAEAPLAGLGSEVAPAALSAALPSTIAAPAAVPIAASVAPAAAATTAATVAPTAGIGSLATGAGTAGTLAAGAGVEAGATMAAGAGAEAMADMLPLLLLALKGGGRVEPQAGLGDFARDKQGRFAKGGRVPARAPDYDAQGYGPPMRDSGIPDYDDHGRMQRFMDSPNSMGIVRVPWGNWGDNPPISRHTRPWPNQLPDYIGPPMETENPGPPLAPPEGTRWPGPRRGMADGGEVEPFDQQSFANNLLIDDYASRMPDRNRPNVPMWQRALNVIQGYDADAQLGGFARGGQMGHGVGTGHLGAQPPSRVPSFQAGGHGLVPGMGSGRADTVRTAARRGSYVLPADVVSGAGEGNTLAGAHAISTRLASRAPQGGMAMARGGIPEADHMPVAFSGGEYVVDPDHVAALGDGDPEAGSKLLDNFVAAIRAASARAVDDMPDPR